MLDPFCRVCYRPCRCREVGTGMAGHRPISPRRKLLVKVTPWEKSLGLFSLRKPFTVKMLPKRTDHGQATTTTRRTRITLFGRQAGHCAGCNGFFEIRNFTIDHIVAKSKGGTDHIDNLQLLCGACNSMKGTKSQAEFLAANSSGKGYGASRTMLWAFSRMYLGYHCWDCHFLFDGMAYARKRLRKEEWPKEAVSLSAQGLSPSLRCHSLVCMW